MLARVLLRLVLLSLCSLTCVHAAEKKPRIVFLGDSITDGNSYPQLIGQALEEAGLPVPTLINAGIGGDTAAGMLKRLERDVYVHAPTLMTLSAGINDVMHKVEPKDYEASVTAIAEELKAKNIPLLILTTSVIAPKHGDADKRLENYNAILRALATKEGCALAEVNGAMNTARAGGTEILEDDGIHPNYAGHRIMARAVLDALGRSDVELPKTFRPKVMPGIVRKWQIRMLPEKSPVLDETAAAALKADDTWTTYRLPEKDPLPNWWHDQERQRGFAMSLEKKVGSSGKDTRYQAYAELGMPKARKVFLNPGGQVRAIWLNGKRIYAAPTQWTGWHAGRERIPAEFIAGTNVLILETQSQFFLSITEDDKW